MVATLATKKPTSLTPTRTKADVTETEVKHPYGVAKFQANAAKYSEVGAAVVAHFWYVIKKTAWQT